MSDPGPDRPAVDPLLGKRLATLAQIADVRLVRLLAELYDGAVEVDRLFANTATTLGFERLAGDVVYKIVYDIGIGTKPTERDVAVIEIGYQTVFTLPEELSDPSDEEFDSFGRFSVMNMMHPYFRELVQSTTARFGIPPLLLAVVRSPYE